MLVDFHNRERECQELCYLISQSNPQSVLLLGERMMGKSSLLEYIYNHREEIPLFSADHFWVFLDGQTINSENEFWRKLFQALLKEILMRWDNAPNVLGELLTSVKPDREDFLDILRIFDNNHKTLLLFIDDFGHLVRGAMRSEAFREHPNFTLEFFMLLRASVNASNLVIVASSTFHPMDATDDVKIREVFNYMHTIILGGFDAQAAISFIDSMERQDHLSLITTEKQHLLDIAGFSPYLLRAIYKITREYIQSGNAFDAEEIKQRFGWEMQGYFEMLWDECTSERKRILKEIAEGAKAQVDYRFDDLMYLKKRGYLFERNGTLRIPLAFADVILN